MQMRYYKGRWKKGSEKYKMGVRDDALFESQYFLHQKNFEVERIEDDGVLETREQNRGVAS